MTSKPSSSEYRTGPMVVRGSIAGALMGLANLVPGISGGTMLLAAGVYPQFIDGVADVTTLRLRPRSVLLLTCIVLGAAVAILGLAGPVSGLVIHHRWVMYSLFIGLTLGGVPLLWPRLRPLDAGSAVAVGAGIAVMVAMAFLDPGGTSGGDGSGRGYGLLLLAGVAGASAMVLPGVSGGYLLLVLGQYVVILSAIAALKDGARARDWSVVSETMHVIVPVGIGVVVGIVVVSNVVKLLLHRFERPTIGVLLGLLLGAVVGLWPFQVGRPPEVGSVFRGDVVAQGPDGLVMERSGRAIEAGDYDTAFFRPSIGQIGGAAGLVLAGFLLSTGIAHLGGNGRQGSP